MKIMFGVEVGGWDAVVMMKVEIDIQETDADQYDVCTCLKNKPVCVHTSQIPCNLRIVKAFVMKRHHET